MNNTQSVRIRKNELNRTIFMILTNQQMAFGTVWIDYASNSINGIGGGKLLETTVEACTEPTIFTSPPTATSA